MDSAPSDPRPPRPSQRNRSADPARARLSSRRIISPSNPEEATAAGNRMPTAPGGIASSGDDRSISADSLAVLFGEDSSGSHFPQQSVQIDRTGTGVRRAGDDQRFEVRGELGRGGMGTVDLVYDHAIRREVARKRLLLGGNPDTVARFIEEGQITGQLEHPNIVPVHDMGVDAQGQRFITLKRVKGRSLRQLLTSARLDVEDGHDPCDSFPLERRMDIFRKVVDAVAYAHSRGVIHRDIKPDNIMVGEFGEVLVMDWGLARIVGVPERISPFTPSDSGRQRVVESSRRESDQALTMEGAMLGTPGYMPGEQASGDRESIDERSDVHALGAVLYELLAFSAPYIGETPFARLQAMYTGKVERARERITKQFGRKALKVLDVPPQLEAIARKCLAMNPGNRYQTVRALANDLDRWRSHGRVSVYREPIHRSVTRWVRRHPVPTITLAMAMAMLSVVSVLLVQLAEQNQEAITARETARRQAVLAEALRSKAQEAAKQAGDSADEAMVAGRDALLALDRAIDFRVTNALSTDDSLTAIAMLGGKQDVFSDAARFCVPPPRVTWQASYRSGSPISDAVFTRTGETLVVAAPNDYLLAIIDPSTGTVKREVKLDVDPHAICLSANGQSLVAGLSNGDVEVFDTLGNSQRRMKLASRVVTGVVTSPANDMIAACSVDWTTRLIHWDGTEVEGYLPTESHCLSIGWTADGRFIITGTDDGRVWFTEAATGRSASLQFESRPPIRDILMTNRPDEEIVVLTGDALVTFSLGRQQQLGTTATQQPLIHYQFRKATAMAISPDNRTGVVAEGQDGDLLVFDLQTLSPPIRLRNVHGLEVSTICFSPDGNRFASTSADGWVHIWNMHPQQSWALAESSNQFGRASFSPDCARVAIPTGTGHLLITDVVSGRVESRLQRSMVPLLDSVWLEDNTLVTISRNSEVVHMTTNGTAIGTLTPERSDPVPQRATAFLLPGDDGGPVALLHYYDEIIALRPDSQTVMWRARPTAIGDWQPFFQTVQRGAGRTLYAGRNDNLIERLDLDTGESLGMFGIRREGVPCAALMVLPDHQRVVKASMNGTLTVWSTDPDEQDEPLARTDAVVNVANHMALSPDGQLLVVCDQQRMVFIETRTWTVVRRLGLVNDNFAMSADGGYLAVRGANERTMLLGRWAPDDPDLAARLSGRRRERFMLTPLPEQQRQDLLMRWPRVNIHDAAHLPDPVRAAFWRQAWPAARGEPGAKELLQQWVRENGPHRLAPLGRQVLDEIGAFRHDKAIRLLRR